MTTTGLCLFLACLSFWVYDVVTIRKAMVGQATAIAQVVGLNSAVALTFDDQDAATETLAALSAVEAVAAAVIYDERGQVFAVYAEESNSGVSFKPPRMLPPSQKFGGSHLDLFDEIESAGRSVGTIFLRWNTHELAVRAQWYAVIVFGLLAASLAVAAAISARLHRHVAQPLADLAEGAGAIASGDLSTQVRISNSDEIGSLAQSFNEMSNGLRSVVSEVRRSTAEVSGVSNLLGEAASEISQEAGRQQNAIGDAASSIEQLVASIREVNSSVENLAENGRRTSSSAIEMDSSISEIASNMGHLGESIDQTAASVQQVTINTSQAAKAVEDLKTATDGTLEYLEQLKVSVGEVKANAEQSDELSEDSSREAARGLTAMDETREAMGEIAASFGHLEGSVSRLNEKSQAIEEIIEVINGVAEQTSQLSLNASIIAAQAGEHGKPFAVVAAAVSNVSDRTRKSTHEIADLIRAVQAEIASAVEAVEGGSKKVEQGVQRSNLSGSILGRILEKSKNTSERVREIAGAAQRQSNDLERVNLAIDEVKGIVEQIHHAMRDQQNATSEIGDAIGTIRALGESVHKSTQKQRNGSHLISDAMVSVTEMIDEIASATNSQARSSVTIQEVLEVFRETAAESILRSDEMSQMVSTLSERSQKLEREMGRFKID
jgi:methyl-accepting chemotaxis protein